MFLFLEKFSFFYYYFFIKFTGSSDDWAKGKAGIKYSYTVELRDKGRYGFLLPSTQIIPTGRETFAAIKAIVKSIIDHVE